MTFPADLPDLLRLACKSDGRLRLNAVFGAQTKWQASLANTGKGWTVDHREDCLDAIEAVLRSRFGKMLERLRAAAPPVEDDDGSIGPEDIIQAVHDVFDRSSRNHGEVQYLAEQVAEKLFPLPQPNLTKVAMTTAAPVEVDEFDALL